MQKQKMKKKKIKGEERNKAQEKWRRNCIEEEMNKKKNWREEKEATGKRVKNEMRDAVKGLKLLWVILSNQKKKKKGRKDQTAQREKSQQVKLQRAILETSQEKSIGL